MSENLQAGFAVFGSNDSWHSHAGFWVGNAASFVDLHSVLGSSFGDSKANAIWTDGTTIKVAGEAFDNNDTGYIGHAILWTITPIPEPTNMVLLCAVVAIAARFRKQ